eukprot:gene18824-biopygen19428
MRRLWSLLDLNDIELQARYIRSEANEWADRLSRDTDIDDWKLNRRWLDWAQAKWGEHTVDCFARLSCRDEVVIMPRRHHIKYDHGDEDCRLLPTRLERLQRTKEAVVVAPVGECTSALRERWRGRRRSREAASAGHRWQHQAYKPGEIVKEADEPEGPEGEESTLRPNILSRGGGHRRCTALPGCWFLGSREATLRPNILSRATLEPMTEHDGTQASAVCAGVAGATWGHMDAMQAVNKKELLQARILLAIVSAPLGVSALGVERVRWNEVARGGDGMLKDQG